MKTLIPNHSNYEIYDDGRVFSLRTQQFLSLHQTGTGYLQAILSENGRKYYLSVHRLVAEAFIPNPLHLPCVNHKDENKLNNNVNNLEWISYKDNINYGTRNYRMTQTKQQNNLFGCKPILQLNKNTLEVIKEWPSINMASRMLNLNKGNLSSALSGKRPSAGGYKWKYKE